MNKRHYEHTLPNIRGSLSNTYKQIAVRLQNCCSAAANRYAVTLQKVCSRFAVAVQYDSKLCMAMLQRAEKD